MELPHQRYKFKPGIGSSHSWALSICRQLINSYQADSSPQDSFQVLDIGAGSGIFASQLKSMGPCVVDGVEIDEQSRNYVAPLYNQVAESIEAFKHNTYQLILLLDVIEHVADPKCLLAEAIKRLKPGGQLLISVPNIAHWSTRLLLFFGRFNYTERGILDRTHLRFFTSHTLRTLVAEFSQLEIVASAVSIEPIELLLPETLAKSSLFALTAKIRSSLAQCVPGLMGFQVLLQVKKIA